MKDHLKGSLKGEARSLPDTAVPGFSMVKGSGKKGRLVRTGAFIGKEK